MPFHELIAHRPSTRDYRRREKCTCGCRWRRPQACCRRVCTLHPWTLGFKQSSLNPIAQALRGRATHAFLRSPLYQHALVPSAFRLQVSWFASESVPELRPISSGIISVRTTAHTLAVPCSTGNIAAGGKSAPLARLVRPGLPGDASRLNGVTETC